MKESQKTDETVRQLRLNPGGAQAKFLERLQAIVDLLSVTYAGASNLNAEEYAEFRPFNSFWPAENRRMSFELAQPRALRWLAANAFRDAVEAAGTLLEDAWLLCSILSATEGGGLSIADLENIRGVGAARFHRRGIPDKLSELEDLGVAPTFGKHLLSLNRARNCLVHREGVVSSRDADSDGVLRVFWRETFLEATSPDGTEVIRIEGPGQVVEGGWSVSVRQIETSKEFKLGETIILRLEELTNALMSLFGLSAETIKSIEDRIVQANIQIKTNTEPSNHQSGGVQE